MIDFKRLVGGSSLQPRSIHGAALGPLVSRVVSLLVSAVGSVLYSKLLLDRIGVASFGRASLVVAAGWILPVLVDGSRTLVVNAVSRAVGRAPGRGGSPTLKRAARTQMMVGLWCGVVGAVVGVVVWWVTGDGPFSALVVVVGVALAVSALGSPGAAVLQGKGLQSILNLLPMVTTALSLLLLVSFLELGAGIIAACAAPVAGAAIALGSSFWSIRRWGLPVERLEDLAKPAGGVEPHRPGESSAQLLATVATLGSVLFFMSDRYIISGSDPVYFAAYVLLQQLSTPLIALTGTVGDGLWAFVEGRRGSGEHSRHDTVVAIAMSTGIACAMGFGLLVIGPIYAQFMLAARPEAVMPTSGLLAVLVISSGAGNGASALLRDLWGLRVLASVWWLTLVVKVGGACLLVATLGPVWALAAGVAAHIAASVALTIAAIRSPAERTSTK